MTTEVDKYTYIYIKKTKYLSPWLFTSSAVVFIGVAACNVCHTSKYCMCIVCIDNVTHELVTNIFIWNILKDTYIWADIHKSLS